MSYTQKTTWCNARGCYEGYCRLAPGQGYLGGGIWGVVFWGLMAYLAPWGGRGSCLGLRTGVSPHFSTSSKREMLADHERGAAPPPSGPMPDNRGWTLWHRRDQTQTAPGDGIGRRRRRSVRLSVRDAAVVPTTGQCVRIEAGETGAVVMTQLPPFTEFRFIYISLDILSTLLIIT